MKAYITGRVESEKIIQESGLNATNPYKIIERFCRQQKSVKDWDWLNFIKMTCTLQYAIENPYVGTHILEVEQIPNAADLKLKNLVEGNK